MRGANAMRRSHIVLVLTAVGAGLFGALALRSPAEDGGETGSRQQTGAASLDRTRVSHDPNGGPFDIANAASASTREVVAKLQKLPMPARFSSEDRDKLWAPRMEQRIEELLDADLKGVNLAADTADVQCREYTCRLTLVAPDAATLEQATKLFFFTSLGDSAGGSGESADVPGRKSLVLYVGFTPEHRELDQQLAFHKQVRKQRLEEARSEGSSLGFPLPSE